MADPQTAKHTSTSRLLPVSLWAFLLAALLCLLFVSWQQTRNRMYSEMESLLPVIESNALLLIARTDYELKEVAELINNQKNLHTSDWIRQFSAGRANHSQVVVFSDQGNILSGTLPKNQLKDVTLTATDRQRLDLKRTTQITSSLKIFGGNYLTLCRQFQILKQPVYLCGLISNSSDLTPWQYDGNGHYGGRILREDGILLMATPLTNKYQQILGQKLAPHILNTIQPMMHRDILRFFDEEGADHQQRLGVLRADRDSGLVYVLSAPITHLTQCWISDSRWFVLMWLISAVLGWQLMVNRNTNDDSAFKDVRTNDDSPRLFVDVMQHINGAAYQLRLPDHRLKMLSQGGIDLLPDSFSVNPESHSILSLIHPDDQRHYLQELDRVPEERENYEIIYRISSENHDLRWVMDRGKAVNTDSSGTLIEGVVFDITEHILAQQHVEYLATRDPLTELMNRYYFSDELINIIDKIRPENGSLALLFIDLDRFKTVNDSLGHQVGDRLLKLVSERLKQVVKQDNCIARLGGDEFIIMMVNPQSKAEVESLAQKILDHVGTTFQLDFYRLTTTCSIGITLCPQDSIESYILLRNADTAMYTAKSRGGNCYQFYTEEMNQKVNARLTLESELRRAIKCEEFELYYQPQVDMESDQLLGAEALIRWVHPTAGIVSPADFIPIAEETGLINEIGQWALMEACRTFHALNEEFSTQLTISVNVSVRQLDDEFIQQVSDTLEKTGLPHELLELEITESLLMNNVRENIRILEAISQNGIRFAMDDFGTGYSSLSYLKQFPISKLKIDRAFVNDITEDPDDEAIVRAIIAMAKSLHLNLVAEGVETTEQLSQLQRMACDSYQGYLFSRPVPVDEFRKLMMANHQDAAS